MADREFLLRIVGDVSDAQKSLGNLEKDVSGFKTTATNVGKAVGGALAATAVIDFGKTMVNVASETEQALGASQSVFEDYAGDIEKFSDTTAEHMGLAQGDFLQLASLTGSLLKGAGVPLAEMTTLTQDLTGRAADMAAMFGGDVDQALSAINSGLKGELDPLEAFGVSLSAAKVEAQAAAMGLLDAEGNMSSMAKATATAALIMEQSADSAGTFAKESDTLAGQTAIASAQFKDLQGELGSKLLPIITQVMSAMKPLLDILVKYADFILPVVGAIAAIVLAMKTWTAIQFAFNAVMALNPFIAFALAVAAFIALLVVAYKKVDWFREAVDAVWHAVVAAFDWLVDQIKNWKTYLEIALKVAFLPLWLTFEAIKYTVEQVPGWFRAMVDAVKAIVGTIVEAVTSAWEATRDAILSIVGSITGAVVGAWQWLLDSLRYIVGQISGAITWAFENATNFVTGQVERVISGWQRIWDWFQTGWGKLKDIIEWPFRSAFEAVKWLWNSTIGGFGFTVPTWIPGVGGKDFRIPEMAKGGIVRGPTLALLGEAGPEAVVPLRSGFGAVTVNVYALAATAEVGRLVKEALDEYARTSGALVA